MKHELIKTDNYLLVVVDDSEIKDGDYRLNIQRGYVKLVDDSPEYYNRRNDVFKKIIAHLPLGSPILEGVPLLPPLEQEDDVKNLAEEDLEGEFFTNISERNKHINRYVNGYNRAKEKYKWTDEDIVKIVEKSRETGLTAEYLMLSLTQPKMPIGFECETVCDQCLDDDSVDSCYCHYGSYKIIPKTTTNPEGQTQWVGKHIY